MSVGSMRKILVSICAIVFGFLAWYFAFFIFYESWVPYYYEEYLSHIFVGVSLFIVLFPLFPAQLNLNNKTKIGYYRAYTCFGLFVLLLCIAITVYMLSTGYWLDNDSGIYKVGAA